MVKEKSVRNHARVFCSCTVTTMLTCGTTSCMTGEARCGEKITLTRGDAMVSVGCQVLLHDLKSQAHLNGAIGTVRTLPSQHSNQRTGILVHGLQSPIAVRRTNFTVLFASSPPVSSTQAPGDRACHALMQGMVNHKETGDAFFSDLPPHFLRAVHRREV